ncbi:hypothetical protein FHS70_004822 [Flammeovirga yaeyamensis]|nr:hypothetical protein [Flammeovirga yaeyamensis]
MNNKRRRYSLKLKYRNEVILASRFKYFNFLLILGKIFTTTQTQDLKKIDQTYKHIYDKQNTST